MEYEAGLGAWLANGSEMVMHDVIQLFLATGRDLGSMCTRE